MKTWLCGNSHTGAIRVGLRATEPRRDDITAFPLGTGRGEIEPFFQTDGDHVGFSHATYAERLQQYTGKDHLDPDALWGFIMGTHNARLFDPASWKTAELVALRQNAESQPVTTEALDACIAGDQHYVRAFLTAAKERGLKVFVISCPPPRPDHFVMRQHGVRPETVQFIHRRAKESFLGFLESVGIDFVDHPTDVVDADGFLLPEYCAGPLKNGNPDPHHANDAYGRRMGEKIFIRSTA